MTPALLRLVDAPAPAVRPHSARAYRRTLGDILVERGALSPADLATALALQARQRLRLGDILLARGMITDTDLMAALAVQYGALPVDLTTTPPDPRLIDEIGIDTCLTAAALPVKRIGGATLIATARPDVFAALRPRLPKSFGDPIMALSHERDIHQAIIASRNRTLTQRAETRTASFESCRFWYGSAPRNQLTAALVLLALAFLFAPTVTFAVLTFWAVLTLFATSALKAAAAIAVWRAPDQPPAEPRPTISPLPVVSILVPLYREEDVVERLIQRLGCLSYPKELLDVCLVTEDDDATTRAMLANARLPHWMRVISVPDRPLKTKPRALNFALDFCRGTIIGIYDAEDAPAADQIYRVVRRFYERGPDVACVQGVLDYYNSRQNWFSRCFTIEYASWFRLLLPGLERMGFAIPLGGTTVFFRREALEKLGGWDAHNVTEDADLGIRLARHGFRTEVLNTVTEEEANCRLWPWVRQRSRWLKGYAMTWSVHMRDPVLLWRQLGARKFLGFQVLFLGTLSQFLLVPVLWSFWLIALGLPHPLSGVIPHGVLIGMGALFLTAEALNIIVGVVAAQKAGKPYLRGWVATLHIYFPLAAIATYKALFEMVSRPFFWDKTQHGLTPADQPAPADPSKL